MPAMVTEVRGGQVPVGVVVRRGHVVCQCRAYSDLDPLERVHHDEAQSAVEDVEVKEVVERRPLAQSMVRALTEWDRVRRQPV